VPCGRPGRPMRFSDSAIELCLTLKTLPGLLAQIPEDEQILSVGGDGAYDTRACHAAIAERGADAVIPVRRNGQPWAKGGPGVDARNEALRATKRLGRTIWKKWSG
jgi:hypothetical protein